MVYCRCVLWCRCGDTWWDTTVHGGSRVNFGSSCLPGAGNESVVNPMGAGGQAVQWHPGWIGYQRQGEGDDKKDEEKSHSEPEAATKSRQQCS